MDGYEVYLLYAGAPPADAGESVPIPRLLVANALEHTRDWPEAAARTRAATSAIKIIDPLPSPERLIPFLARVAASARGKLTAILWAPAERLISPAQFKQAVSDNDPLSIAVNIRQFHVEDGKRGEMVMETLGLAPLGLPDVQCHFLGLGQNDVAAVMFELARYLADEGEVISEGDTVPGPGTQKWICHLEESLLEPVREVIDLEPPRPHALRPLK